MHPASIDTFTIEPFAHDAFDVFLQYLDDHLSDNGAEGTGYFQPFPRNASRMPPDRAEAFRGGLQTPVGAAGWRRLWTALGADGRIAGHIDLRAHSEGYTEHRCLLGMGVHRDHRKLGLGLDLIAHAENWARESTSIEWIDLKVLSINEAAIRLYRRAGFETTGETDAMFKIDGQSFSYTSMARRVR
jgi:ribosomal protein S18 acetylase RimI-like enzyme